MVFLFNCLCQMMYWKGSRLQTRYEPLHIDQSLLTCDRLFGWLNGFSTASQSHPAAMLRRASPKELAIVMSNTGATTLKHKHQLLFHSGGCCSDFSQRVLLRLPVISTLTTILPQLYSYRDPRCCMSNFYLLPSSSLSKFQLP